MKKKALFPDKTPLSWGASVRRRFLHHPTGVIGLTIVLFFAFIGIYAPFFASSRPIVIYFEESWYFPLFRYLFYSGFYSKGIDIFFNILMFTLPLGLLAWVLARRTPRLATLLGGCAIAGQLLLFPLLLLFPIKNPEADPELFSARQEALKSLKKDSNGEFSIDWAFTLRYLSPYAQLNLVVADWLKEQQHRTIVNQINASPDMWLPTLWQLEQDRQRQGSLYLAERRKWIDLQRDKLKFIWMPLLRPFHWEEDAAGSQSLNKQVCWPELTRINRKDLLASLCFGIRISLVVGFLAVAVALLFAIPIGAVAGYKGGLTDIIICRFMEIWESMPPFFMLLFIVAMTQSKSIFLVIAVIGLFSWTSFARYLRGEMLKQRSLPYVEACHAIGFNHSRIIFSHLLPNAIPPLLTLLPFAIMGAITSEAGLSFLGLGEEGSSSWGVLMDEGRSVFSSESYLLWPPALLLTLLLVAIALAGDALRDAIDPKS